MTLFKTLTSKKAKLGFLALCLSLGVPTFTLAQDAAPKKELSEKAGEEFQKAKAQADSKNYDGAIAILDALEKVVAAESYDLAQLASFRAQIYLQKGDFAKAIQPLEFAVQLSDKHNFLPAETVQTFVDYLAKLYYQEATQTKVLAEQQKFYEKAIAYTERWNKNNTKPNPDNNLFFASLLYNYAQIDPNKVDSAMIKRAQEEIQRGLAQTIRPKEGFYLLLLATYQQQNETVKASEILELLVSQYPSNKQYWQQLAASYLNLQQDIRAVLTIERAQKNGIMNTPKDNFNLVGIYFNMQQWEYAINLLESGLRSGGIESEQRNWELLAASYQQLHKEDKAIETLKEASKLYPKAGSLDLQIAQLYYGMDKSDDAYKYAKLATSKDLEKPWQAQIFLAYVAYEQKKLDEALEALNAASQRPEGKKDADRLRTAVEDAIREREALKKSV